MKNTLRIIYFSFCLIILSAAVAQAQTACPTSPDVTVFNGSEDFSTVQISDCEWSRQEIFIAAPAMKEFLALNKRLKKMEEKRLSRFDVPYKIKMNGTDLNLYKIDLKQQKVTLVLA